MQRAVTHPRPLAHLNVATVHGGTGAALLAGGLRVLVHARACSAEHAPGTAGTHGRPWYPGYPQLLVPAGTPNTLREYARECLVPLAPSVAGIPRDRRALAQSWFRWHVHSAYFDCPQTLIMPPQPKPRIAARCEARAGSAAVVLASYCERVRCVARATVGSCDLSLAQDLGHDSVYSEGDLDTVDRIRRYRKPESEDKSRLTATVMRPNGPNRIAHSAPLAG